MESFEINSVDVATQTYNNDLLDGLIHLLPFELDFPQRELRGSLLKEKEEKEQEGEKETGSNQNMSLLDKAYIQYNLSYAKK